MKKFPLITTSLCAALLALSFGGGAAYAEDAADGINYYPQNFTEEVSFTNLLDYEIGENKILFLDGTTAYEYAGDRLTVLDATPAFDNYKAKDDFKISGYYYYIHNDEAVKVLDTTSENDEVTTLDGFCTLKQYGDKAYAVKENVLYELSGTEYTAIELPYLNFNSTKHILTGNAEISIRQLSLETPVFVELDSGAFMTQIDIDKLGGEFFAVGDTIKAGAGISALLLATTGEDDGISVVMLCAGNNSKCYILNSGDVTLQERDGVKVKELGATVTVADGYIYTAPYVCDSTKLVPVKSGDPLKVVGEITKEDNPELVRDFYKVEYETEDGTVTGYVPLGYVSPFTYIENDPVTTPDPDYDDTDKTKEVLLVIVVIVLVLAAVGYIIYVLTSNKSKNKNKEK